MNGQAGARNPTLCDLCQKKPKFGAYNYCGKKCASQATNLCLYCHQKPRFNNYSFCSKNCGSLAKAQGQAKTTQNYGAKGRGQGGPGGKRNVTNNGSTGLGFQLPPANQMLNAAAQILAHVPPHGKAGQIASTAAQILPHVQAMFQPQVMPGMQPGVIQPIVIQAPKTMMPQFQPAPVMPLGNATNLPTVPGSFQVGDQAAASIIVPTTPTTCRIPGCQQPVYIDQSDGVVSEYCSMLHREEAVKLGVADACIMCLKMPQSSGDHFCGKGCRDEALSRPSSS